MSGKIFISYRRLDSAAYAGRIYDRLEREFGRASLFMDVDSLPPGINFVKALKSKVVKCKVLLAIIDRRWLKARDEDGKRRLDNKNDFVRVEIAAALKRDIRVIPVLLDGTKMPKAIELPDDLKDLASRSGFNVRHDSFSSDVTRLVRALGGRKRQGRASAPTVNAPLPREFEELARLLAKQSKAPGSSNPGGSMSSF
jgi:TIR domain